MKIRAIKPQLLLKALITMTLISFLVACSEEDKTSNSGLKEDSVTPIALNKVYSINLAAGEFISYEFTAKETAQHPIFYYAEDEKNTVAFSFTAGGSSRASSCSSSPTTTTRRVCSLYPDGVTNQIPSTPIIDQNYTFKLRNKSNNELAIRVVVFHPNSTVGTLNSPTHINLNTATDGVVGGDLISGLASYYHINSIAAGEYSLNIVSTERFTAEIFSDSNFVTEISECRTETDAIDVEHNKTCLISLEALSEYFMRIKPDNAEIAYTIKLDAPSM